MHTLRRVIQRKIRIGRMGVPLWAASAVAALVLAGAGQAVGPVLSGDVTGTAGVTAEQAIVLGEDTSAHTSAVTSGPGGGLQDSTALAVVNDEGTAFTAAVETIVGQTDVTLDLDIDNMSNDEAAAVLELNVPPAIDVDVSMSSNDSLVGKEAQMQKSRWLLSVLPRSDGGDDDKIIITIEPKDDAKPGFHTLSGRIVQLSG